MLLLVEGLKNGVITSGSRSKMAVVMVFVCRFSLVLAVTRFAFCPILQRRVNFVSALHRVDRAWEHRDGFWRDDTRPDRARSIIVFIKTNVELRFRLGSWDMFLEGPIFVLLHCIDVLDVVQQWPETILKKKKISHCRRKRYRCCKCCHAEHYLRNGNR